MAPELAGATGLVALVAVMMTGIPIGFAFALVGFVGFGYMVSVSSSFDMLPMVFFETFSSYTLTVIPMFVFMGYLASNSGVSERLFNAAYKLFGRLPGGLFMGTIAASAAFGACCGSSPASAAAMGTVAIPQMRRYKYSDAIATGCIAASGSLAILIPPSITLVVYGILTEQSVAKLFMAGVIPGIVLALLFLASIVVMTHFNPKLGPAGPATSFKEKALALGGTGDVLVIFVALMGGLFVGFFTPTEAGSIGAIVTLLLALARRTLTRSAFINAVESTLRTSTMILLIIAGASVFSNFLAVTKLPFFLANWVGTLPVHPYVVLLAIVGVYLVLGCFMDTMAMILLTIPIFYPAIQKLGFDPIWFGVLIVLVSEMGLITPPVGINVYVVKGLVKDVKLETIFSGIYPFLACELLMVLLVLFFPQLVLFLPGMMK